VYENEVSMAQKKRRKAMLALEDGRVFHGWAIGSPRDAVGEVVFNTSMTGYQEILTDPSYKGQIVTMTYPLIGNYGVNEADVESRGPHAEGFVVRELCKHPSNWRSRMPLAEYMQKHRLPGIEGIDTRALTKHIRTAGAMRAALSSRVENPDDLVDKARQWPGLEGRDMVRRVSCKEPFPWPPDEVPGPSWSRRLPLDTGPKRWPYRVVAVDFGIKFNILRLLQAHGCSVTVVPGTATGEEILGHEPDGVFLSNGPGDPAAVTYGIEAVRDLIGKVPIFGICLGHQILALALGAKTFKMKFGHRGANQPVKELATGRVHITSQNHGFCVDTSTLDTREVRITHVNLNDDTLEGFELRDAPAFSVQHHPEASPGPHDSMRSLFEKFTASMEAAKS
jgi:carbamoyl-phosphate synthase small subunit